MSLKFKTWLERVEERFDEKMAQMMISEVPHTKFAGTVPPEFDFLKGAFVDMGFENFEDKELMDKVFRAFGGTGVVVPGSPYRLRHTNPGGSIVEPVDGTEQATFPEDWKQYVMVLDLQDRCIFVGKKVRADQTTSWSPPTKLDGYRDVGDGWVLEVDKAVI